MKLNAAALIFVGLAVALHATPARCSVFGEENATLGLILTEMINAARDVRENLRLMRENTEFARDSAAFAREMVQVGKNGYFIVANPAEFTAHMTRSWYRAFPELYQSVGNVYDMRESMRQASRPSDMPNYDPYAYVRALDRLAGADASLFDVWAHSVDRWGISKPHDESIDALRRQHEAALKNVADVVDRTGLSPTKATLATSRGTAISAVAQVEAAAALQRLNRTLEIEIFSLAHGQENARAERDVEEAGAARIRTDDWDLDPMRGKQVLEW